MRGHRRMARALNDKGYNLIRLPRADLAPFLVLGKAQGEVALLGPLTELLQDQPEALPTLAPTPVVGFNQVSSGSTSGQLGLSLLDGLLEHLGMGTVSAGGRWSAQHEVELRYEQLEIKQASMATVSKLVSQHSLDVDGPLLSAYLQRPARKVFVISAVLYSRCFRASVRQSTDGGGHVEVPLKSLGVDAQAASEGERERAADVLYEGEPPMAIGFQCFELDVDRRGRLSLVNSSVGAPMTFSGGDDGGDPEPSLLVEDDAIDL